MWLGISCFAFRGELQASYSCSLETVWPWDGGLSRVSGSPDIKASEKQTLKRHDGPTFPQPLPRLPPDRRQALDLPNSPPHNNQQSKNKITRNTTPIWPLHTRTCAHGLACSKPACAGKLRPLWPFLLRPHLGHAPRPPLPARPLAGSHVCPVYLPGPPALPLSLLTPALPSSPRGRGLPSLGMDLSWCGFSIQEHLPLGCTPTRATLVSAQGAAPGRCSQWVSKPLGDTMT